MNQLALSPSPHRTDAMEKGCVLITRTWYSPIEPPGAARRVVPCLPHPADFHGLRGVALASTHAVWLLPEAAILHSKPTVLGPPTGGVLQGQPRSSVQLPGVPVTTLVHSDCASAALAFVFEVGAAVEEVSVCSAVGAAWAGAAESRPADTSNGLSMATPRRGLMKVMGKSFLWVFFAGVAWVRYLWLTP